MEMHVSTEMIEQIAKFEGCRLDAYLDIAGVPTIGIGHTGKDVVIGDKISLEEAYRLFRNDVWYFENELNSLNETLLAKTQGYGGLTQRQFDAILSLIYNTGAGAIGNNSTFRKLLLGGCRCNYPKMCNAFMLWVKYTDPVTKEKKVSKGLTNRRAREAAWYVYGANWENELKEHKIVDVVEWAKN